MPKLIIIAGCNGSGKSTFAPSFLPDSLISFDYDKRFLEYYNEMPDSELREKFAKDKTTKDFEDSIEKSLSNKTDFCYETNFDSYPIYWAEKFKENGFTIDLIFFCLKSKEIAMQRVEERTEFKGHFVDNETIDLKSKIIITTAYEKYALKGFDLQVSDYLLKPITFERFIKAYDKVSQDLISQDKNVHSKIFIKTEHRLEGIDTSEILYIEGLGDYRRIVTQRKKIMTLQTFKELLDLLPSDKFFRVHNSYVVSKDMIEKIERNRITINEKLIPISESYGKEFYKKINS